MFKVYIHTLIISFVFFLVFFLVDVVMRCGSLPLVKARALHTAIPIAIALLLTAYGASVAFSAPKVRHACASDAA